MNDIKLKLIEDYDATDDMNVKEYIQGLFSELYQFDITVFSNENKE